MIMDIGQIIFINLISVTLIFSGISDTHTDYVSDASSKIYFSIIAVS